MQTKSESTTDITIFLGKGKEKMRQAVVTVDVVIPALNEERCIRDLLNDVMMSRQHSWFTIQYIYVISDASTDQTDDIVQQASTRDRRVKLIRKRQRKGKQDSINLAFSITNAAVLVFLDADVRLASEHSLSRLVMYFHSGEIALVQGGLVRIHPGHSLSPVKQAAYFDWILADRIRRQKAMSWWSIDGRVMALSRDFYQHLYLPSSLADDQFIFYSCIQQRRKFVWAQDAIFYYGPPVSIADFSHQWSRYFFYTNKSRQNFGNNLIAKEMGVSSLWRNIISSIAHHPFCGLMWSLCYSISRIEFARGINFDQYEQGFFWTTCNPLGTQASGNLGHNTHT